MLHDIIIIDIIIYSYPKTNENRGVFGNTI